MNVILTVFLNSSTPRSLSYGTRTSGKCLLKLAVIFLDVD